MSEGDTGFIAMVCTTGNPWPFRNATILIQRRIANSTISVMANPSGNLTLTIEKIGTSPRVYTSQSLAIAVGVTMILRVQWEPTSALLSVNRDALVWGDPQSLPVLEVKGSQRPVTPEVIFYPGLDRTKARSDAEALFLGSIKDIGEAQVNPDWYKLLRASACMRQLLLEQLVHKANQKHDVELCFIVNDITGPADIHPDAQDFIRIDPSIIATASIHSCTLDRFLATKCLRYEGGIATVKDVITAMANSKGGVHLGSPRGDGEKVVLKFDDISLNRGIAINFDTLVDICRTTLEAMRPLVAAITNQK